MGVVLETFEKLRDRLNSDAGTCFGPIHIRPKVFDIPGEQMRRLTVHRGFQNG